MSVMIRIDSARRIDVGAARHVLLEDVVLNGAHDFLRGDALLLGDGDVHGEENRGGGVDRHGGGDFVEGNLVEEDFHVGEGIDGDADFADLPIGHGAVGIVSHLGRQIEGHREPGLPLLEEIAVALVGFLGGAETCILAHGPERPRYIVGCTPRVKGYSPGKPSFSA
jgi:hypothetical protein